MPKVSVVMSVYDGKDFLKESIDSILEQTFQDFEFIIIDDDSSDDTFRILNNYKQKDSRVKILKNMTNLGLTKSLKKGLITAKGKYIARMDCGDISMPDRLRKQAEFLDKHKDYGLIGTSVKRIDNFGHVIKSPMIFKHNILIQSIIKIGNVFVHGSVMFRKDVYEGVGFYREMFVTSQDYDLWTRIAQKSKVDNLSDRLYLWRQLDSGISTSNRISQDQYAALASYFYFQRRKFHKDDNSYFEKNNDTAGYISSLPPKEQKRFNLIKSLLYLKTSRPHMAIKQCAIFKYDFKMILLSVFAGFLCTIQKIRRTPN